jgi:hypothetical protein
MSIPLLGTGGLFTRLGKLAKVLYAVSGHQAALNTVFGQIAAQYATLNLDIGGRLANAQVGLVRGQSGIVATLRQAASDTVLAMVLADQPAAGRATTDALKEVIRQMIVGSASVQVCSVGVTVAALGSPTGTGTMVYTTKRGDGLVQENLFAEVGRLLCTADSFSGGQTAGREPFAYVGPSSQGGGIFDYDWPVGSDANTQLVAVSADQNAATSGNLLTNGNFESSGSNWSITGGVLNTDYAFDTSTPFRGLIDLKFIAGTAATPVFAQVFGDGTNGTGAAPAPLTSYIVNLWVKRDGVVSAGVLTVDLVDGSGSIINDQQGAANSFTKTLSGLTTSYTPVNGTFRLPAEPPATIKLRVRISTALTGANVYVDDVCMTPATALYTGGPGLAVFSGVTPFATGDTWTVTQTNDRGGATYAATWQAVFDRFFSMRSLGLLLPSSGSPTIADSLISPGDWGLGTGDWGLYDMPNIWVAAPPGGDGALVRNALTKSAGDALTAWMDYGDFPEIIAGAVISSCTVVVSPSGPTVTTPGTVNAPGYAAATKISGGTAGNAYLVTFVATLNDAAGTTYSRTGTLNVVA